MESKERNKERSRRKEQNPAHPTVSDPPVPNRAHTEMVTEFPPEVPNLPKKEF